MVAVSGPAAFVDGAVVQPADQQEIIEVGRTRKYAITHNSRAASPEPPRAPNINRWNSDEEL